MTNEFKSLFGSFVHCLQYRVYLWRISLKSQSLRLRHNANAKSIKHFKLYINKTFFFQIYMMKFSARVSIPEWCFVDTICRTYTQLKYQKQLRIIYFIYFEKHVWLNFYEIDTGEFRNKTVNLSAVLKINESLRIVINKQGSGQVRKYAIELSINGNSIGIQ